MRLKIRGDGHQARKTACKKPHLDHRRQCQEGPKEEQRRSETNETGWILYLGGAHGRKDRSPPEGRAPLRRKETLGARRAGCEGGKGRVLRAIFQGSGEKNWLGQGSHRIGAHKKGFGPQIAEGARETVVQARLWAGRVERKGESIRKNERSVGPVKSYRDKRMDKEGGGKLEKKCEKKTRYMRRATVVENESSREHSQTH